MARRAGRGARRDGRSRRARAPIVPGDPATTRRCARPGAVHAAGRPRRHRRRLWLRRAVRRGVVRPRRGRRGRARPRVAMRIWPSSGRPQLAAAVPVVGLLVLLGRSSRGPGRPSARRPWRSTPRAGSVTRSPLRSRSRAVPRAGPAPGDEDERCRSAGSRSSGRGAVRPTPAPRRRWPAGDDRPRLFRPAVGRPARDGRARRGCSCSSRRCCCPIRRMRQSRRTARSARRRSARRSGSTTWPGTSTIRAPTPTTRGRGWRRSSGSSPSSCARPGRPRPQPRPARLDRRPGAGAARPRQRAAGRIARVARAVAVARGDGRSGGEPGRRPGADQGQPQGARRPARGDDPEISKSRRPGSRGAAGGQANQADGAASQALRDAAQSLAQGDTEDAQAALERLGEALDAARPRCRRKPRPRAAASRLQDARRDLASRPAAGGQQAAGQRPAGPGPGAGSARARRQGRARAGQTGGSGRAGSGPGAGPGSGSRSGPGPGQGQGQGQGQGRAGSGPGSGPGSGSGTGPGQAGGDRWRRLECRLPRHRASAAPRPAARSTRTGRRARRRPGIGLRAVRPARAARRSVVHRGHRRRRPDPAGQPAGPGEEPRLDTWRTRRCTATSTTTR